MIQATILYPDGRRVEAVVLAIGRHSIRAIPRDGADTLELSLQYGQWCDETGAPVEVESLLSDGDASVFAGMSEAYEAAATAQTSS